MLLLSIALWDIPGIDAAVRRRHRNVFGTLNPQGEP